MTERLHAALRQPFVVAGHELVATTSVGVALCTGVADTSEELLRYADMALYRAKETGRACTACLAPAMGAEAVGRLGLERDLRQARAGSSSSSTSPRWTWRPGGSPPWRRWSAGGTRRAGSSRPATSSPSPRRPA